MNEKTTEEFLNVTCGQSRYTKKPCLLIWDSASMHISQKTKDYCKKIGVNMAVIPPGTTGLIQGSILELCGPFFWTF